MIKKRTEWTKYNKGEANCYSWKLERVQVKVTDSHYINNLVDHVTTDNKGLLRNIDKIILIGNGNPIALYPKDSIDLSDVCVYLESIKDTDIHTIVLSLGESSGIFVDTDAIEDTLAELNSVTKIEVRFIIAD